MKVWGLRFWSVRGSLPPGDKDEEGCGVDLF